MGTVYKKNSRWRAEVHKSGQRRSKMFDTRAEAKDWIAETEAELLSGPVNKPTMRTAIDRYLKDPARSRWDALRLTAISKHDWSKLELEKVTASVLSTWRDERLTQVKPATVIREMTLLRSLFEAARRDWEWVKVNPIKDVKRPPATPPRNRVISDAERDEVLKALEYTGVVETIQHEAAVALLIALETGMRAGEILSLTWELVDSQKQVATLLKSKTGPGRQVPLSKEAVRLLDLMRNRKMLRLRTARGKGVFHLSSQSLDVTFRRARKAAGLSGFTFHDARATAITRLAKKLEPLDLARMMGHSDLSSLLTYYRESAASIAERLD